jgi:hypothetical protein
MTNEGFEDLMRRFDAVTARNLGFIDGLSLPELVGGRRLNIDVIEETCWPFPVVGRYTFLAAASVLEVVSDDVADTVAGTGLRNVRVIGLDTNYLPVQEDFVLNGLTPVVGSVQFLRVNNFLGIGDPGTPRGSNIGNITVRVPGPGAVQDYIPIGAGCGQKAVWTSRSDKRTFIASSQVYVPTSRNVNISLSLFTPGSVAMRTSFLDELERDFLIEGDFWREVPPRTDIEFIVSRGSGAGPQADCDIRFSVLEYGP